MAQVHDVKAKKEAAKRERESGGSGFSNFFDFFHIIDILDFLVGGIRFLLKPLKFWN